MNNDFEIAIVGGGIMGLSIAYNLAKLGVTNTVVLEKSYLASGASGRNGGGIRQQWTTKTNIELMKQSMDRCDSFAGELGVNVWLRQGGYLFLARSQAHVDKLEKSVKLQRDAGLPTRLEKGSYAKKIVPGINTNGVLACAYNPTDGVIFPWPFLWGYSEKYCELGGEVRLRCEVTRIERKSEGFALDTTSGKVNCKRLINACGAWSPEIAALLHVDLPTHPIRHQICSSEPLKACLEPLVSDLQAGLYFSQSMRGEIVGGINLKDEPHTTEMKSSLSFLREYARALTRVMPGYQSLKVLRQWSGPYDHSPDGNPILGEHPDCKDFFLCNGFVGHGFMMAPIVGELYAKHLAKSETHQIFSDFRYARFSENSSVALETFNIG